ncbi:hypothetical protein A2706_00040 [Candidatus Peribacteria bacterium RIFCSPHIGHO2_01_FULL_51_35]|nr:MAG: hypothetical protein A2706_00040 [Candidatus Peribacteria bacterium RIFCSPHIGHO2_01_FULL_51_35]
MRLPKPLEAIIIGMILFVAIIIFWEGVRRLVLGYPPAGSPEDTAAWVMENNKHPDLCFKMGALSIPFPAPLYSKMGPSTESNRKLCVFLIAQKMKDPRICELLLPGEYGLACISDLWPEVLPEDGCGWDVSNPKIFQCRHIGGPLRKSAICNDFSDNVKQFSACISYTASRDKSLEQCKNIPDADIRLFCQIKMKAWMDYPELRDSFYFGKQIPSDNP